MAPLFSDISAFMIWLCWECLVSTTNAMKNPIFNLMYATSQEIEDVFLASTISFAPDLLAVLQASNAPTVEYLKSLPLHLIENWAVYVLVLEKPDNRPKVYIGSGTAASKGIKTRLSQYDVGHVVPRYVQCALNDGFKITHKGLLCWCPIPAAGEGFKLRGLFLIIECVFTLYLWPMISI